jgi:hypothetical protein
MGLPKCNLLQLNDAINIIFIKFQAVYSRLSKRLYYYTDWASSWSPAILITLHMIILSSSHRRLWHDYEKGDDLFLLRNIRLQITCLTDSSPLN